MSNYAARTSVPVAKSKLEIERVLQRYGATEFGYGTGPDRAMVGFVLQARQVRFTLPLPSSGDAKFRKTPTGQWRRPGTSTDKLAHRAWEQACRQKWRALALCIKAKLEAVDSGIATLDEEFLGYIVLPNGDTFAEWATPQLDQAKDRHMPHLLAQSNG